MNDTQRVLSLFRASKGRLIANHEIIAGQFYGVKPILEYTGRISDSRKILNCSCGQNKDNCTATEHIISAGDNKFFYKSQVTEALQKQLSEKPVHVDIQALKAKRLELKKQYLALRETDPMRKIIEVRGKAVKNAIDLEINRQQLEKGITQFVY